MNSNEKRGAADISRYKFIRMPVSEQWGVLVRKDSAFAGKSCVHPEDLRGTPLIMARRETVKNELINWFGDAFSTMETAAAYNLITNAVAMVENRSWKPDRCWCGSGIRSFPGLPFGLLIM